METALEASFYVLAVIIALGVLMVLVLFKDIFFHGRFTTILPPLQRVPNSALDAPRELVNALKAAYAKAQGERQSDIAYEIRHLEHRIDQLEDKAYVDQADYYDALKLREKIWREWRSVHEEARLGGRSRRRVLRPRLEELKSRYAIIDREVDEEFQRAVARDILTLEELKVQGVLEPEVLFPRKGKEEPEEKSAPGGEDADKAGTPGEEEEAQAPDTPASGTPARPPSKWPTPLAPYPPAQAGQLRQADLALPSTRKSERTYVDPTMSLAGMPQGAMQRENFNLSSFAEVQWVGLHRYVACSFIGTDLRRIELLQAAGVHLFQDCDFKGASLAQSRMSHVVFRRCNLSSTHWRGAKLDRVMFEDCPIEDIHWEGVDLSRTSVTEAMAQDGDFSAAGQPPRSLPQGQNAIKAPRAPATSQVNPPPAQTPIQSDSPPAQPAAQEDPSPAQGPARGGSPPAQGPARQED